MAKKRTFDKENTAQKRPAHATLLDRLDTLDFKGLINFHVYHSQLLTTSAPEKHEVINLVLQLIGMKIKSKVKFLNNSDLVDLYNSYLSQDKTPGNELAINLATPFLQNELKIRNYLTTAEMIRALNSTTIHQDNDEYKYPETPERTNDSPLIHEFNRTQSRRIPMAALMALSITNNTVITPVACAETESHLELTASSLTA